MDISKLNRKQRRELLAKTLVEVNYKLGKFKKYQQVLVKYQDDLDVMALIRHGQHRNKELNYAWTESKRLTVECVKLKKDIEILMEDGNNRPRDTDKKSTGLHPS